HRDVLRVRRALERTDALLAGEVDEQGLARARDGAREGRLARALRAVDQPPPVVAGHVCGVEEVDPGDVERHAALLSSGSLPVLLVYHTHRVLAGRSRRYIASRS